MQFNTSTDYAIRLVLCLAKESKTVSSSKLSAAIGVSSGIYSRSVQSSEMPASLKLHTAEMVDLVCFSLQLKLPYTTLSL